MKRSIMWAALFVVALVNLAIGQPIATPEAMIPVVDEVSKWLQPDNLNSIAQIIMVIIGIASPFLLKGFHALIALAQKKSQNELIDQLLEKAEMVMPAVTKAVYEEYVKGLREGTADKPMTLDNVKVANKMAYDKVVAIIGPVAMATFSKNGVDLEKYVEGLCGIHVENAKIMYNKVSEEDSKN